MPVTFGAGTPSRSRRRSSVPPSSGEASAPGPEALLAYLSGMGVLCHMRRVDALGSWPDGHRGIERELSQDCRRARS